MPDPTSTPRALHDWIRKATFDLCDEARARLYAEIEEHFLTAVEEDMARGKDRAAAETAALKALGNPFDAGNAFRRSYLTPNDLELIRRVLNPTGINWRSPRSIATHFFIFALFFLIFYMVGGWSRVWEVCIILLFAFTFSTVTTRLAERYLGTSVRGRLLTYLITWTATVALIDIRLLWLHQLRFGLLEVMLFMWWYKLWPIIRKLGRDPQLSAQLSRKGPDQYA